MSTVPLSLKAAFLRSSTAPTDLEWLAAPLRAYAEELQLDAAFALTSFSADDTGKRARELAVYVRSGDATLRQAILDGLPDAAPSLQLAPWSDVSPPDGVRAWRQGNAKATRKQVSPALRALLDSVEA